MILHACARCVNVDNIVGMMRLSLSTKYIVKGLVARTVRGDLRIQACARTLCPGNNLLQMDVASRFRGCSPISNGVRTLYSGASSSRSVVVRKPKEKGVVKVQAFRDLDLGADVLNAVEALDFDEPTEIQSLVIQITS